MGQWGGNFWQEQIRRNTVLSSLKSQPERSRLKVTCFVDSEATTMSLLIIRSTSLLMSSSQSWPHAQSPHSHHSCKTDRHPFNGFFSRTTWVTWHQRLNQSGLYLVKQEMMAWQWHQLNYRQIICTSLQTENHVSTLSLNILQAGCSFWRPTNSVKALKGKQPSCNKKRNKYICVAKYLTSKSYAKRHIRMNDLPLKSSWLHAKLILKHAH